MKRLLLHPLKILESRGGQPYLIVHAEHGWFKSICDDKFDFFVKLELFLKSKNIDCFVIKANSRFSTKLRKHDHIHLMVGDIAERGHNIFHVMPAYVWGFWYLDNSGVHWNSSIRSATFRPETIDGEAAEYFFNGVSGHMLRENVSKMTQADRVADKLPEAAAVIYLQQIDEYKNRVHYLDTTQMVSTVARVLDGARVYVKPHPDTTPSGLVSIQNLCAEYANIEVSNASIHDLTAASSLVVTQNSAAGFEALMQKNTVITCAKSDYWHATRVARSENELEEFLMRAEVEEFPFEKYLYWYLRENCLEPQDKGFEDRVLEKILNKGLVVNK